MRYEVGQKYAFVHVDYTNGDDGFAYLYRPWVDILNKIDVLVLTCAEHHKVAEEWDPKQEKKYDGFIFVDEQGNRFFNQYPNASYGQLDDSNDRRVWPEDIAAYPDAFHHFTDALSMVGSIVAAINPEDDGNLCDNPKMVAAMTEYRDQFVKTVEAAINRKIVIDYWVINKKDGTQHKTKILRAEYTDVPEAA